MRKILIFVSILMVFVILSGNVFAVTMTLEEAVKSAKSNSDELRIAELELDNLLNGISQYRTELLPKLNVMASKTKSNDFDSSWEKENGKYVSKLVPLETERYDMKLVGEYKLLDLAFLSKDAAMRRNYDAAYANYNQKIADLEFKVISIYYRLILEEQLKNILEEEIEILDKYLEDLKLKVDLQYTDKQRSTKTQSDLIVLIISPTNNYVYVCL